MTSTRIAQVHTLGNLAPAKGKLGPAHSRATSAQMQTGTRIVTSPANYTRQLGMSVVCVEDRLHRLDPRLAGGGVALGLMNNLIYGGSRLSRDFGELKAQGIRVVIHDDCGAFKLAPTVIKSKLSDVNADGYQLLASMGVDVPMGIRKRIATWAVGLPKDYVDTETARAVADEIDQVQGEHNAVFAAVSLEDGVSFAGGPLLKRETKGLLSFVFDPWVARRMAQRITVSRDDATAAEILALVFTAQVFLTLGGPDLKVAVHQ